MLDGAALIAQLKEREEVSQEESGNILWCELLSARQALHFFLAYHYPYRCGRWITV